MKNKFKKDRTGVLINIVFIAALIIFIVMSFFSFVRDNGRRILEQNDGIIRTATEQTAARINDIISNSKQNVKLLANLYGEMLSEPTVDESVLQDMISRSPFDYVEFISSDGTDLTATGETADLSDREYFKAGMRGESGKCVIHNSRITDETLLIFYTPFYYDGEIIGVLSAIIRGDTLLDILSSDFFGVQGSTYLLERSGDVILSVNDKSDPENIIDAFTKNDRLSQEDLEKLRSTLDSTNEVDATNFNYKGANGEGNAYVMALADREWMIMRNLPSSLTRGMTGLANSAGIVLEIKLAAAFVVYMIYLVVRNQIQKRRLVTENQEMSNIVSAATQLFCRFSLVDYEKDTYVYLTDDSGGVPKSGSYTDLIRTLEPKYIYDDKDTEKISTIISADYVREHLTEDVPYLQYEYQIDMGGQRWENISIICIERKDGVPASVLYAIQDVTGLKEREREIRTALKNASEAALAASRAKSEFLARMSHDIRTPMNAIMGMTAVAAMHLDDEERLTDCLSKITISSRHLLALINDVLDMSKIESGKVTLSEEPFGMADMVESVVTIIRAQVNAKRQEFRVHISDISHENVIGDTLRLRQIFVNILGNAVKFTPEGGVITFTIRELPTLVHGMAQYEFVCKDTGMGMDKEFLKTVFDPFSRSEDSVSQNIEGTGLGMSITRNIVQMMEGDIRVESELGVGSTFTVRLHLKLQDSDDEDVTELADLRVLVADDDETACVAAGEILTGIGMKAEWVLSGDEAIERTEEAHGTGDDYAAVILDWKMPGRDGVETAREIRRRVGEGVPIIILSAYDWTEIETTAREAGISAFIEKPLFRSRLIYALKSVLAPNIPAPEPAEGSESGRFAGRRVLLVEDNELNREIATELLEFIGVAVETAADGREALEAVRSHDAGYYDLVFMDIQMPVMNGYESATAIRALDREDTKTLPIVAMTANAFADDIARARDSGMNDHMAKPVEVAKLREALEKWIKKA